MACLRQSGSAARFLCYALGAGAVLACEPAATDMSSPAPDASPAPASFSFTDVTVEVGLDFVHEIDAPGDYSLPAVMGGGAAIFDYDGDGDLDLYLVRSGMRPLDESDGVSSSGPTTNRLYRQESDGRFTDVTDGSGLGDTGYGMGCAVGDVDNDGDLDVYVTNWGRDELYRNLGDGRFRASAEIDATAGGFSTSAAFFDYDRDGFLDLYVARYVRYRPQRVCTQEGGRRDFCGPTQFPGESDLLFHNEGGRRLREVGREAGIGAVEDAGLGVVAADFDGDGWQDLYVANDADPNNLWINQRDGTFVDDGVLLGAAFNGYGVAEAGMGIAVGDSDGDGDLDLFVSHLIEETHTYYENRLPLGFEDRTAAAGLAAGSVPYTGFGTAFFDADNDGDLDLAVVQGGVKRRPGDLSRRENWFWSDYAEPNLLLENRPRPEGRGAHFFAAKAAPFDTEVEVSRGLVPADVDGDGDLDLLVTNLGGPARLYRNDLGTGAAWIELRLLDAEMEREAWGARVSVRTASRRHVRHAIPHGGYLTSGPPRIHLGLGDEERVEEIEVRWPGGDVERYPGAGARQVLELRRGSGLPAAAGSAS